eukprot:gene4039-4417_t
MLCWGVGGLRAPAVEQVFDLKPLIHFNHFVALYAVQGKLTFALQEQQQGGVVVVAFYGL